MVSSGGRHGKLGRRWRTSATGTMDTSYVVGDTVKQWLSRLDRHFGTAVGFERLLAWAFVLLMVGIFAATVGPYLLFG